MNLILSPRSVIFSLPLFSLHFILNSSRAYVYSLTVANGPNCLQQQSLYFFYRVSLAVDGISLFLTFSIKACKFLLSSVTFRTNWSYQTKTLPHIQETCFITRFFFCQIIPLVFQLFAHLLHILSKFNFLLPLVVFSIYHTWIWDFG